ncbi:hypothetical protein GYMLUDRAFT_752117 [Collybiopsis luxurians FD-317 M1]|uniref:Uncharacterized protein n=1 Tax=Collybiopsis luxurians FD-317 M1 TaxID=944289 RepID=A0A0D0B2Z2_9AGAR|nr:hypothetical protein GYMLUDRAFT_752117 [Collybiopsis luxurians FD-317 M1]
MSIPGGANGLGHNFPPHHSFTLGDRGVSTNFEQSESMRGTYRRRPHSSTPNVSFGLSQGTSHRTSGHTHISGGFMSSVGRDQTIDTDHHNSQKHRNDIGVQNNSGTIVVPINIHIHFGSGADSRTLTWVISFSFGLFGRGDSMIMRWS